MMAGNLELVALTTTLASVACRVLGTLQQ